MSVVDTAKAAYDLAKKGMTVELQEKIMQLREEALKLQEENLQLKSENQKLKEQIELQEMVTFKRKVYWREGDEVPFCPCCYERTNKLIHLNRISAEQEDSMLWFCQECSSKYRKNKDEDFRLASSRSMR